MSRSVKTDYDRLRIPTLHKMGAILHISDELLFQDMAYVDARYDRKANKVITLPTQETWGRYRAALKGLRALQAYEFTEWGGPDYDTVVPAPEPVTTYEYLETNDEWLARCRALRQEGTQ